MKKLLLVFGFVFFTVYLQAQIVTIPDNNFRNKLLTYTPAIDTNADGQIQVSEALVVTTLNVSSRSISNATGISAFANLQTLDISSNLLTTLDVTPLIHLTSLNCSGNQLTNLNVSTLTNLTGLACFNNHLTTLDVTPLTYLTSLSCFQNQLTALDVSTLINLTSLDCPNNFINSLDISTLTNLVFLRCSQNNLTSLNIPDLANLETLFCSFNQLTTLELHNLPSLHDFDCSGNQLASLDLSHLVTYNNGGFELGFYANPNLVYVNLKSDSLLASNAFFMYSDSCPALRYICANENTIAYVINKLQQNDSGENTTISSNIQVNSYCSFVPTGNHNTITANVKFDANNNGCDINDILANNVKILISDGTNTGAAFTNTIGNANFYTQAGNFVITPNFENSFFTVSPTSTTINFANSNNNSQTQNFCITPLGIHNDLEIVIIPTSPANPGFNASYRLVYKNKGNQIQSGSINLNFNDAVLDFVSANPMTTSQSINNLNWDFTNLNPFESRTIHFVLNVNSPMETPPVNINDLLSFTATISPIQNDETPEDNVSTLRQTVIGSLDPNDKTCVEGNTITPDKVGDYLHYVIRFQNSGTAAAQNIVVKDIIDTTKFDINTLQLTSSSHPNVARITGNKVEFIFENINLPAEVNNEPGSHGYVAFKIKTKSNLVLGNTIQNTANIYFDYNFPIVTNTTSTIVAVLNVTNFEINSVSIAPIPVVDLLQIKALENITRVQLFDIQGRLLQTQLADSTTTTLDFSGKSKGVYLVKVQTEKGIKVQKVIKE